MSSPSAGGGGAGGAAFGPGGGAMVEPVEGGATGAAGTGAEVNGRSAGRATHDTI